MTQNLADKSAGSLLKGFAAKRFSPLEALDAVLARIETRQPTLNAFQLIDVRKARRAAHASTARWTKSHPAGQLDGVPIAIKDVTETKGWPTLNGSLAIDPKGPWKEDAVVVERFAPAVRLSSVRPPRLNSPGVASPKARCTASPETPGILIGIRVGPAVARVRRSLPVWFTSLPAPTQAAPSADRRAFATSLVSSRPSAGCRYGRRVP